MKKLLAIIFSALVLHGCASYNELKAASVVERNAQSEKWAAEQQVKANAYVDQTCAYAKNDSLKWGDCNRQTRQWLYEQSVAAMNRTNDMIRQQNSRPAYTPPRPVNCTSTTYGNQVQTNCY